MSFRRLVFVTLLLSASIPAGIAQLYVEGDYVGTASSMSCSATARYMSGVFNWQIDYDWFVGARAIVTGPRSSSMGESGYGIVTARAGVSEFYGSLPGGCYYFDMEGSAQNPRTGEVSPPQGGRIGDLCFDNPTPPGPPPVLLTVYANMAGSVTLLSNTSYPMYTDVTLTAVAPGGWVFAGWSGSITSVANPISFTLGMSMEITANFVPIPPPPDRNPAEKDPAQCPPGQSCNTPIILNLGRGEYQLTGIDDPVWFDMDADGTEERTSWTARYAPMGFLAHDRDGNGVIDDASELFGNHTPVREGGVAANGFDALAEYDANRDGVLDSNDPMWSALEVWIDLNHDGYSQAAEIIPLSATEIMAIDLNYHWTGRRDAFGNTFRYQSQTRLGHAVTRPVYDIFLTSVPHVVVMSSRAQ